jgi:hypothetical protein
MIRTTLILLLLFTSLQGFSQIHQKSSLYFNNGKLRADSSFAISVEQFKIWRFAENNLAAWIASEVSYPKLAERNGIEGLIIVAFDCQGDEITNIRVVKQPNSVFTEVGIATIQRASANILKEFKFWKSWSRNELKYRGTYFIPIDFSMIPFEPELKKKAAIPMIKISGGGLGYPAH